MLTVTPAVGSGHDTPWPQPTTAGSIPPFTASTRDHGTRAKYVKERCRCEPCTEANRVYARARYRADHRPDELALRAYVPADDVRAHLCELAAAGVGYKAVARAAGLTTSEVVRIRSGALTRVRRSTRQKLLAITVHDRSSRALVPAGPSLDLVAQLLAAGRSRRSIALAVSSSDRLQLGRKFVRRTTADAIERLAREVLGQRYGRKGVLFDGHIVPLSAPWTARAACLRSDVPTEAFFSENTEDEAAALAFCGHCSVRQDCLDHALATGEQGVWGGTTDEQRRRIRRREVSAA